MDGPREYYAQKIKISQRKTIPYDITYTWKSKKNKTTNEGICKTETKSQIQKINLCLPKNKGKAGGTNQGYKTKRYKLT